MTIEDFLKELRAGEFLDRLDSSRVESRSETISWLRLVTTEAIGSWARSGSPARILSRRKDVELMSVLFERHVLNLATRRDPSRLIDFWQWMIGSDYPQLKELWQRHDPTSVMNDTCILHQEIAFGQLLAAAVVELKGVVSLEWAYRQLRQWSAERDPNVPLRPQVRVVFALEGVENPPEALRPAFVVTFRLLSPTANPESLCSEPEVFGPDFLKVFDAVKRRIDRDPRQLEHDAGFLGSGVLDGTSGTLALLTGQWLAARPRFIDEVWMTLPPWVVITATLDWQTDKAAGVGGVDAKVEVLTESGVRYVIVGDETPEEQAEPGELPKLDVCPTHSDLHGLLFSGTVTQLADQLRHLNVLHQADMVGLQGTQLEKPDSDDDDRLERLNKFRFVEFRPGNDATGDFVPPTYAYEIIQEAIESLLGRRGYVHLTGGPGIGKSLLVASMRPSWEGIKASAASVIGHAVLRGHAENPSVFIEEILTDALRHAERVKSDSFSKELRRLQIQIFNRQSSLPIQQGISEIVACVRRHLGTSAAVIMAIDGLDELTMRDSAELSMRIHELLPAPEQLEKGCYVLLTSRSELRAPVRQALEGHKVKAELFCHRELSEIDPGYEQIVRTYVINKLGSEAEHHLPVIMEKSQRRFLWVRLQVELLQLSGTDVTIIPAGQLAMPDPGEMLPAYIEQLEQRVRSIDQHVIPWIRPTLLVTAAAFEPITRDHYTAWLQDVATIWNKDTRFRLDAALIALQPLLKEDRFTHPHDHAYSIAHREITDWLNGNQHPEWKEAVYQYGHRRIVDRNNPWCGHTHVDFYAVRFLPKHCHFLGSPLGVARALAQTAYLWSSLTSGSRISRSRALIQKCDIRLRYDLHRMLNPSFISWFYDADMHFRFIASLLWTVVSAEECEIERIHEVYEWQNSLSRDTLVQQCLRFSDITRAVNAEYTRTPKNGAVLLWEAAQQLLSHIPRRVLRLHGVSTALAHANSLRLAIGSLCDTLGSHLASAETTAPVMNKEFARECSLWYARECITVANIYESIGDPNSAIELTQQALLIFKSQALDSVALKQRASSFLIIDDEHHVAKAAINLAHFLSESNCDPARLLRAKNLAEEAIEILKGKANREAHGETDKTGKRILRWAPEVLADCLNGQCVLVEILSQLNLTEERMLICQNGIGNALSMIRHLENVSSSTSALAEDPYFTHLTVRAGELATICAGHTLSEILSTRMMGTREELLAQCRDWCQGAACLLVRNRGVDLNDMLVDLPDTGLRRDVAERLKSLGRQGSLALAKAFWTHSVVSTATGNARVALSQNVVAIMILYETIWMALDDNSLIASRSVLMDQVKVWTTTASHLSELPENEDLSGLCSGCIEDCHELKDALYVAMVASRSFEEEINSTLSTSKAADFAVHARQRQAQCRAQRRQAEKSNSRSATFAFSCLEVRATRVLLEYLEAAGEESCIESGPGEIRGELLEAYCKRAHYSPAAFFLNAYFEAVKEAKKLEINPEFCVAVRYSLAWLFSMKADFLMLTRGRDCDSIAYYSRAIDTLRSFTSVDAELLVAQCLLSRGVANAKTEQYSNSHEDFVAARTRFEALLRAGPLEQNLDLLLQAAYCLMNRGNLEIRSKNFDTAIQLYRAASGELRMVVSSVNDRYVRTRAEKDLENSIRMLKHAVESQLDNAD